MALFEVYIWNRLVRISDGRPIKGSQGQGYVDRMLIAANSEDEAMDIAFERVWNRPMLGVSPARRDKLVREIEIRGIKQRGRDDYSKEEN